MVGEVSDEFGVHLRTRGRWGREARERLSVCSWSLGEGSGRRHDLLSFQLSQGQT